MRKFFAEKIIDGIAYFDEKESYHMTRVLRKRAGDMILVPEGQGQWTAELLETGETVTAKLVAFSGCDAEPKKELVLYAAYIKSDKLELVTQKAVELGVTKIVPFISSRCVKVPDEASAKKANIRLERIAHEALKQCGRGKEITVSLPISFEELIGAIPSHERVLFAYEAATESLREALKEEKQETAMIIGPEGGFSEKEAERIIKAGGMPVSLGTRILRAETAAIALLAIAAYEMGC